MTDIEGHEGRYAVTKDGRVWSYAKTTGTMHDGRFLSPTPDKNGYFLVGLSGKLHRVHRLVAQTFIPNPEDKPQVNHINGDKQDNRVENLEWATPLENMEHAHRNGWINPRDHTHQRAKLTEEDVADIRMFHRNGIPTSDIAKVYPICYSSVWNLITGKTYKELEDKE